MSILIGFVMVVISIILIRKEFIRANRDQKRSFSSLSDENVNQVMQYLKKIEKELDELNSAYYEIVSDLEGKYSVHDKEIELLQEKLESVQLNNPVKRNVSREKISKSDTVKLDLSDYDGLDEQSKICREAVRLKQTGLSMGQIAKELNMGIGELQLLLKTKG